MERSVTESLSLSTVRDLLLPGVVNAMGRAGIGSWDDYVDYEFMRIFLCINDRRLPGYRLITTLAVYHEIKDGSYKLKFRDRVDKLIASYQGMVEYASWLPAA